jgi:hypothetical protein
MSEVCSALPPQARNETDAEQSRRTEPGDDGSVSYFTSLAPGR